MTFKVDAKEISDVKEWSQTLWILPRKRYHQRESVLW